MDASEQLYRVLSADAGVRAITETVRPMRLADGDGLPAIVYQIINTRPTGSLHGDTSNLDHVRVQVDSWAPDYGAAVQLGKAVRDALRPPVPLGNGHVLRARFIDENFDYNDETRRYRCRQDFYIWQRPH